MIDLCKIKEDFSVLVKEAQPWTLTQFVMWLDLKLSEFKIKGYMVLDHQTKTKPQWIAADDTSSDVVPSPAPCRQCNKHDTNFYSDIHASPASKRQRQSETVDDSEPIRGEVGVIDLSHAELNRRGSKSDLSQVNRRGNASVSLNRQEKNISRQLSSSANVNRDIGRKETVIEIDPVSPTEKMFLTNSTVSKTSTPIQSYTHNESKHKPPIVGTALYTSTQSSTMPTFSTGHISSASGTMPSFSAGHISSVPRTVSTFSSRSFALGAPPTIATTQSQPPTTSNLDEMIAQAVKFNEIRTDPTSSQQVSRMEIQTLPSRVQDNVQISNSSHSSFVEQSHGQNIQQSSPTKPAVPVALHANIDNISREESHSHSSSDITEIKIEQVDTEEECHITDSFFTGKFGDTDNDTSANESTYLSEHDNHSFNQGGGPSLPPPLFQANAPTDIDLPEFEDPIVRRALEDNRPPSRNLWSKIITRCAYHLLSKGVPRKHDYQTFAEKFYRQYPCVGTTRGPNPWTYVAQSLSSKIRKIRWKYKKDSKRRMIETLSHFNNP